MPKRHASSPQSAEHTGKYARRASPMQVDVKSASPARGVPERSSRPYNTQATKPKTKSPMYHTAKSHSRTYFSIPVSRPPPPPTTKPPLVPVRTKAQPVSRPKISTIPFPHMLRNYYHAQLLKLKQQFGFQPFQLTMRVLVPFFPDKVYAKTSLDIAKDANLHTVVNTLYKDLEKKRNTTVTFETIWMIYRTHAIHLM